ncbi:MAG: hypothetical protein NVS2B16_19460 [Chloroflexota bacterium]
MSLSVCGNESGPDLVKLGAFIRDRRVTLGMTQRDLAERAHWAQARISLLERGGYGLPSVPHLARLAAMLEISLSDVLEALGYANTAIAGPMRNGPLGTHNVSRVAHEVSNHLTTARGRMSLVRLRAEREGQADVLDDARKADRALREVQRCIAALLTLTRQEQAMPALQPEQQT